MPDGTGTSSGKRGIRKVTSADGGDPELVEWDYLELNDAGEATLRTVSSDLRRGIYIELEKINGVPASEGSWNDLHHEHAVKQQRADARKKLRDKLGVGRERLDEYIVL